MSSKMLSFVVIPAEPGWRILEEWDCDTYYEEVDENDEAPRQRTVTEEPIIAWRIETWQMNVGKADTLPESRYEVIVPVLPSSPNLAANPLFKSPTGKLFDTGIGYKDLAAALKNRAARPKAA